MEVVLETPNQPIRGMVLAVQANFYRVRLVDPACYPSPELLCTRRTRLKKIGQQVMVGDHVSIAAPDWQGLRGAIVDVLPRSSQLQRPPVANANQILLVFALAEPVLDSYQLSRFLVTATATGLEVCLGLSKCDLVSDAELQDCLARLQEWGYTALPMSLRTGQGLDPVRVALQQKVTVVSGPSGVGKSSLINALMPGLQVRVGAVSAHWGKGKHTTRHVELFELPAGGLLADSPGFNQPTLVGTAERLAQLFPEIQARLTLGECQFSDCLHRDEPNCVVRGDWPRYAHYLEFLREIEAQATTTITNRGIEAGLKQKSRTQGQVMTEPKLELKRYRRTSRRSQHQDLQQFYDQDTDWAEPRE
jgi:ribosome biogenesis GTPase / thiamine phosphate phosphatase